MRKRQNKDVRKNEDVHNIKSYTHEEMPLEYEESNVNLSRILTALIHSLKQWPKCLTYITCVTALPNLYKILLVSD